MNKVAINGLGRIGRATLKIILETPELELTAINDIAPMETLAYLLTYDTVYGRFGKSVQVRDGALHIEGRKILMLSEKDPAQLPWKQTGVQTVFECTGLFRKIADMQKHIDAGATHAILSAPSKSEEIATVVHGTSEGGRPAVYSDIVGDPRASVVDLEMTKVIDGDLVGAKPGRRIRQRAGKKLVLPVDVLVAKSLEPENRKSMKHGMKCRRRGATRHPECGKGIPNCQPIQIVITP